jgi:hypothetical protein
MAAHVFAVPQLFEAILLQLPLSDLLLSQRTSQVFRDTICDSIKLQRALHFVPIQDVTGGF